MHLTPSFNILTLKLINKPTLQPDSSVGWAEHCEAQQIFIHSLYCHQKSSVQPRPNPDGTLLFSHTGKNLKISIPTVMHKSLQHHLFVGLRKERSAQPTFFPRRSRRLIYHSLIDLFLFMLHQFLYSVSFALMFVPSLALRYPDSRFLSPAASIP